MNSTTGKDSTHITHGIMQQDIEGLPESHAGLHVEILKIERQKRIVFEHGGFPIARMLHNSLSKFQVDNYADVLPWK